MDEPFGAIDPINRDRLQNEFLRLQREIRKTIVFVTHDIDEAIKMGDRIAILREGGELVQYDTPDRILAEPADEFVAQFVGVDRGLKRLSLSALSEIELDKVTEVREGDSVGDSSWHGDLDVMLVDSAGPAQRSAAPLGRVRRPGRASDARPLDTQVSSSASLREALSRMMTDSLRPLLVVGDDGPRAARLGLINIALRRTRRVTRLPRRARLPPDRRLDGALPMSSALRRSPSHRRASARRRRACKDNDTFCWDWFKDHWCTTFVPALLAAHPADADRRVASGSSSRSAWRSSRTATTT